MTGMRAHSPLFKSPMLRTSPEKNISLRDIRDSPFLNDQIVGMVRPQPSSALPYCRVRCRAQNATGTVRSGFLNRCGCCVQERSGKIERQSTARDRRKETKRKKKAPPKVRISDEAALSQPRAASLPALGEELETPMSMMSPADSPWMARMRAASTGSPSRTVSSSQRLRI